MTATPSRERIRFELDGEPVEAELDPGQTALSLLRRLGRTSLKEACTQGVCGACTALVDGRPRPTCTLPARKLHGRSVTTLEGLPAERRELLAAAFASEGGLQCGYCTPGMLLEAHALLEREPEPGEREIRRAFRKHLCRCTGWQGILRAVRRASELLRRGAPPPPPPELPSLRLHARELALGRRPFLRDLQRPGLLHGALRLAPLARCRVLRVDPSPALALPGVRAVLTARDLPGDRLLGPLQADWPALLAEGEDCPSSACVLAVVAAETPELARRAARLVEVEVEPLPGLYELEEAARHPERLLSRTRIERGEVEAAFVRAAVIVEERFETQRVDPAFLEPEAALAEPLPGGGYRLLSPTQGVFPARRQLERLLGLGPGELVVEQHPSGGSFGGREDLTVEPHALALARATGRPVRVELDMAQALRLHTKRHPMLLHYRLAADAEGRLLALEARILGDTGAHASVGAKTLERSAGHAAGPYRVPALRVEALAIRTDNPPSGAMRGFGVPQVAFAMEGCMDRLAERLGLDPLELRLRNALRPGDRSPLGERMGPATGIVACLEALRPHYEAARAAGLPVGLACAMKNTGLGNGAPEEGRVELRVLPGPEGPLVEIRTGFSEMGQGHDAALVRLAARASGLPASRLRVRCATDAETDVGMTTSSRATFLAGRAVLDAAAGLRRALEEAGGLEALLGRRFPGRYRPPATRPPDAPPDDPRPLHYAWGYAAQLAVLEPDGRIRELVAAQDVGRALDPLACRAQVEGAVHMGLGYALTEEQPAPEGLPETRFARLGIVPVTNMPPVRVLLVEVPDPEGPEGAKGIGELGLVPTAPAVAAALHAWDGRWRSRLPMRDTPAARALLGR